MSDSVYRPTAASVITACIFLYALYWATISLTTVGYGDVYAVTTIGKIITMISSFLGIAVVALPAGIITSGLMDELSKSHDE